MQSGKRGAGPRVDRHPAAAALASDPQDQVADLVDQRPLRVAPPTDVTQIEPLRRIVGEAVADIVGRAGASLGIDEDVRDGGLIFVSEPVGVGSISGGPDDREDDVDKKAERQTSANCPRNVHITSPNICQTGTSQAATARMPIVQAIARPSPCGSDSPCMGNV